jgi:elongation of very long chain fatty acids protein 6
MYLLVVIYGQREMQARPRYDLSYLLFLWNVFLAAGSTIGAVRGVPIMLTNLWQRGFKFIVCDQDFYLNDPVMQFWAFIFAISKVPELGDTLFIVLRKQKLSFLHWYHHVTVLIYTWYSYAEKSSSGGIFGMINGLVHSCMYTYFAFRSLKFRIPIQIAIALTTFQLSQMAIGCIVNAIAYYMIQQGETCGITISNIKWAGVMYLSYLILFAHFFYKAYIAGDIENTPLRKLKNLSIRDLLSFGDRKKVD